MAESKISMQNPSIHLGAAVDISSYTSTYYTFPSDGYLVANCGSTGNAKSVLNLVSSDDIQGFNLGGWSNNAYPVFTCFVRKGMRAKVITLENSGKAQFFPFV